MATNSNTAYDKLTRTNDAIRSLTGLTDKLTLDDMYINMESVVSEVQTQSSLIDQINTTLIRKAIDSNNVVTEVWTVLLADGTTVEKSIYLMGG